MQVKGILFDLYGTLIDIETDESMDEIYRAIGHYLTYQGASLRRWEVREHYYRIMRQQKEASAQAYPEIDVEAIWNALLLEQDIRPAATRQALARIVAHLYRGVSRKRLQLYPEVKRVLDELQTVYQLGLISDAQPCYALPEIQAVGLNGYFDPVIISADYGFRKPDSRLFENALDAMKLKPSQVIYVGNDMFRDIYGASLLGIKSIFIDSNQGAKSYYDTTPDYFAQRLEDVAAGIYALSLQK